MAGPRSVIKGYQIVHNVMRFSGKGCTVVNYDSVFAYRRISSSLSLSLSLSANFVIRPLDSFPHHIPIHVFPIAPGTEFLICIVFVCNWQ